MADQLEIVIGADATGLQQGLTAATKAVEKFDQSVKKSSVASGQATQALTNLGRVASDAPFGFIAIANNIEPLVQSLQSLGRTSGGIGGALKALGGALIGPAGLLLAFSVVSSAITTAIQKYGSLGNAVSALFGNFTELDKQVQKAGKSYEKYNENLRTAVEISRDEGASVQGQVARVQALAAIANDQTKTYNERNSALKELASINKTYFGDLKIEDGLVKGLTDRVTNYTNSVIASAKAKGFEAEIGKLAPQLAEQEALLDALNKQRQNAIDLQKKGAGQVLPGIAQAAAANQLTSSLSDANKQYAEQNTRVNDLKKRLTELEAQLTKFTGAQVQERIATDAAAEALRIKEENEKKAAAARDANIKKTKDAADAEKLLNMQLEFQRKLRAAPTTVALDLPTSRITELAKANDTLTKSFDAQAARLKQAFGFDIQAPKIDFTGLEQQVTGFFSKINQAAEDSKNKIITQTQSITDAFNTVLAPSIDAVFNALASGQNAFKALGDSLKQLVIQLASTVIKAAALAAILTIVSGGTATPISFGAAFKGVLSSGATGFPSIGRTGQVKGAAAPSFPRGTAFSSGGMQLAGNVTFVQRGTDLVGVLNRGNSQINRLG